MKSLFLIATAFAVLEVTVAQNCNATQFECPNTGKCIPESWYCDGYDDCGDWSDEPEDVCPPCHPGYWPCSNRECIPISYICDGDNDCSDLSDELDPETGKCPLCPVTHFTCVNTGRCVSRSSETCNGENDCGDWSDETEEACPCSDQQVRCGRLPGEHAPPGPCIPPDYICDADGIWDCPGGWDEANCTLPI